MSNYNTRNRPVQGQSSATPPTHIAKVRHGTGDRATYERIGVAWAKEDGAVYVRLYGTQIVASGFTLYPAEEGGAQ